MVPDIGSLHLISRKGKINHSDILQATYIATYMCYLYNSNAVTTSGVVFVKRHIGHLPYEDDKDVCKVLCMYVRIIHNI